MSNYFDLPLHGYLTEAIMGGLGKPLRNRRKLSITDAQLASMAARLSYGQLALKVKAPKSTVYWRVQQVRKGRTPYTRRSS